MADRRRAKGILIAACAVLLVALAGSSSAQLLEGPGSTTTTSTSSTTTTAPSSTSSTAPPADGGSTTTTSTTSPGEDTGLFGPTTTAPAEDPGDDAGEDQDGGETPSDDDPIGGGDGSAPPEGADQPAEDGEGAVEESGPVPRTVPPEARAIIDAVPRTPANGSQALFDATQELVDLGLSPAEAVRVGFGRFPVAGVARYSHDWLFPRYGPGFRFHLGTDVFAPFGTPLRSPVDGTVTAGQGSLGGLYVKVFMDDGTYFYMAHLSGLPDDFVDGMAVRTGDIVGYVGDSGNAKGGSPHLHLGIYPQGGPATDPKPILDQMLADAAAALPGIVEQVRAEVAARPGPAPAERGPRTPRSLLATALLRPLVADRAAGGASTAVLYETVGNPTSGGLAVAEAEAGALVAGIDWEAREARELASRDALDRVEDILRIALGPFAGSGVGDLAAPRE